MFSTAQRLLFLPLVLLAAGAGIPGAYATPTPAGADRILEEIQETALRDLISEVLLRNPGIEALRGRARAASQRAVQAGALPEPTAMLTAFVESPETRTGPQRLAAGFSQALPWAGKLALAKRAAAHEAVAQEALVEERRLELVTETRRLFLELTYLDRQRVISEELRDHLSQHEEIARARYSTGAGHGQGVIKLQAEITLAEKELLEVQRRRIALEARLNGLRDRPALTPVAMEGMPMIGGVALDLEELLDTARRSHPGLAAARARIRRSEARVGSAEKLRRPNFTVGLTYTVVDPRGDAAGRLQPPQGNGDDIVGVQGGITLPVRRRSLSAALEEALAEQAAAEEILREKTAALAATVADLAQRVELDWRRLRLLEDLLIVQAEEAEESALAGYIAGTLNAVELLDAEHVRFEAHTALARASADYLIQIAELEGAIAASLGGRMESSENE